MARAERLPFAVRSGGHCFAGRSSTAGVLIDVSPMGAVAVADGRATVGAGARLGDVYDALDAARRHDPGRLRPDGRHRRADARRRARHPRPPPRADPDALVAAEVVLADGRWSVRRARGGGPVLGAARRRRRRASAS